MSDKLQAFMELRRAMLAVYRAIAADRADTPERDRAARESALQAIDEILEWRPLASFTGVHLEVLELAVAYWREMEVAPSEPRPPEPDPIH